MTTIALIDDDLHIQTSLALALQAEGYAVVTYPDGAAGLAGLQQNPPDLALLDIKMPRLDGFEVLTQLGAERTIPVIILSSKDDEVDQVLGLRLGADDYITKPFSQRLLMERIRAVLRRYAREEGGAPDAAPTAPRSYGALTLDDARYRATWNDVDVRVTVSEYLLLKSLCAQPGAVKTREDLLREAYGEAGTDDDRAIDSHIKRLRKKFKDIDDNFNQIETLYGAGYRYKV